VETIAKGMCCNILKIFFKLLICCYLIYAFFHRKQEREKIFYTCGKEEKGKPELEVALSQSYSHM
jgi:hypothetical protein